MMIIICKVTYCASKSQNFEFISSLGEDMSCQDYSIRCPDLREEPQICKAAYLEVQSQQELLNNASSTLVIAIVLLLLFGV